MRPLRAMLLASIFVAGCNPGSAINTPEFPIEPHSLIPTLPREGTQIAAGAVTGLAPEQPIAFPHDRHVAKGGLDCQYCHSAARNSNNAGIPEVAMCMGCHRYVLKDSPEIKLLAAYAARGEAVPWKKVHDVPDFVYFSHMRHVRANINCTECHGQVQGQAGIRTPIAGAAPVATGADAPAPTSWQDAAAIYGPATGTMTREATLQMGWCLDCHATHASVDKNYGDKAELRRAELKDCWTCHK